MPRGKVSLINRAKARSTVKRRKKDGVVETFKNTTEARAAGVDLPTAQERLRRARRKP